MDKLIENLLDMELINDNDTVEFTDEARELIHIIAEKCRETTVYKRAAVKSGEYAKTMSAEDMYKDMLLKIVDANTRYEMIIATRLIIPLIDAKLVRAGGIDGWKYNGFNKHDKHEKRDKNETS